MYCTQPVIIRFVRKDTSDENSKRVIYEGKTHNEEPTDINGTLRFKRPQFPALKFLPEFTNYSLFELSGAGYVHVLHPFLFE